MYNGTEEKVDVQSYYTATTAMAAEPSAAWVARERCSIYSFDVAAATKQQLLPK